MSTRSAAKRPLRTNRPPESDRQGSDARGTRNEVSTGTNRRLGAQKAPANGSERTTRKRLLVDQDENKENETEDVRPKIKRRKSLEDEQTKDGEAEEDEDEDEDEEDAGPKRTRVDVDADMDFVRALVASRNRMESAFRKMVVWDEIADGRFRNGRAAKARLEWLQRVRRDPDHVEHAKLPHEMKLLLSEYANAMTHAKKKEKEKTSLREVGAKSPSPKKRQKTGFVDPMRQRRLKREALLAAKEAPSRLPRGDQPMHEPTPTEARADGRGPRQLSITQPTYRNTMFDAGVEENWMHLVLDRMTRFNSTDTKKSMWDDIARATGGFYPNGMSMKNHVRWLLRSLRDPRHRVCKDATPKLRALLDRFVTLNDNLLVEADKGQRSEVVEAAPAPTPSAPAPSTPTPSAPAPSAPHPSSLAPTALAEIQPRAKSIVNRYRCENRKVSPPADEMLVRIVLKKMWAFDDNEDMNVERWNKIAAAVLLPSRSISSGAGAKARLLWLLSVLDDVTHEEHAQLSVPLRQMLVDYTAAQKTASQATEAAMLSTSEVVALHEEASVDGEMDNTQTTEETDERAEIGGDGGSVQKNVTLHESNQTQSAQLHSHPDERLMQLVLLFRPFDTDRTTKAVVWAKIVDALANPKITNGIAAQGRVRFLLNAYQQTSSPERDSLSDALRTLLGEYDRIHDAVRAEELAQALNVRMDVSSDEDDEKDEEGITRWADPVNDLLLREILRLRPFHAKVGTGMGVWKEVAKKINHATGRKIYPTGQSCLSQMRKLLAAARANDPKSDKSDVFLSKRQRAMVRFVDALLKVRWPTGKTDLTDDHRACLEKIRRFLESEPEVTIAPRPTPFNKNAPPTQQTSLTEQASIQLTYERPALAPIADPIDVLQNDIAHFRETAARDRATRERELARVKQRVTACRTQLHDQLEAHDIERRERRNEVRTMMDLVKSERALHTRESGLVLEAIQKERDDRRHEFVTLMTLVTRAVQSGQGQQYVPPTA